MLLSVAGASGFSLEMMRCDLDLNRTQMDLKMSTQTSFQRAVLAMRRDTRGSGRGKTRRPPTAPPFILTSLAWFIIAFSMYVAVTRRSQPSETVECEMIFKKHQHGGNYRDMHCHVTVQIYHGPFVFKRCSSQSRDSALHPKALSVFYA